MRVRSCRRRNLVCVCVWFSLEGVVRAIDDGGGGVRVLTTRKKGAAESFLRLNDNEAHRNKVCI